MNSFDARAREWDKDKMHMARSLAIAAELEKMVPMQQTKTAIEYGAGTGILSFLLKDQFAEITLIDSSAEMINVCREKTEYYGTRHIHPLFLDLEHDSFNQTADIIYNQMVMHHINDIDGILKKFFDLINPGGFLAIADLYPEDGSFHGDTVKVHWGFDPSELGLKLQKIGFRKTEFKNCFTVTRDSGKTFPIFLLVAQK